MPGQLIILNMKYRTCQTQLGSLSHFKELNLKKTLTVSSPIPLDVSMNFKPYKNKKNIVKYFISIIKVLCKYPVDYNLQLKYSSFCMLLNSQSPNYLPCQNVQY